MMKKVKVVELFGGIGAIRKAYINSGIPYEVVDYVEIDKNAVKSYNALYGETFKPKSVCDYHLPNIKIDVLMHGSPCQDFSRAGIQQGGVKGSGTRSSLLFETIRIIEEAKLRPTWVIWENVKGVLDKNMRESFFYYLDEMSRLGYTTKYQVLNAMDFGIPQKRERIFAVSYLGESPFYFEQLERTPTKHIHEFLEEDVSERYGDLYTVKQPSMLRLLNDPEYKLTFKKQVRIIDSFCYTISTKQVRIPNAGFIDMGNGYYRYLTERECWKLMGFNDSDIDIVQKVHPKRKNCKCSILYKQAGNSIVVNVLEAIVVELARCTSYMRKE